MSRCFHMIFINFSSFSFTFCAQYAQFKFNETISSALYTHFVRKETLWTLEKIFLFLNLLNAKKFSSRLSGKLFWGILITQMLFYGELWRISSGILRWDSTLDSRAKIFLVISHQNIFPLCNRFINRSWKPQTKREQKK